ncbi:hypothetical protein AA313_de0208553 [Arthrobotrys entomopaga]|nr:hypothetical protein AA313_de0208553 [Arthrobotrys entomopaga]
MATGNMFSITLHLLLTSLLAFPPKVNAFAFAWVRSSSIEPTGTNQIIRLDNFPENGCLHTTSTKLFQREKHRIRKAPPENAITDTIKYMMAASWNGTEALNAMAFYSSLGCQNEDLAMLIRFHDEELLRTPQIVSLNRVMDRIPRVIKSFRPVPVVLREEPDEEIREEVERDFTNAVSRNPGLMLPGSVYVPRVGNPRPGARTFTYCSGLVRVATWSINSQYDLGVVTTSPNRGQATVDHWVKLREAFVDQLAALRQFAVTPNDRSPRIKVGGTLINRRYWDFAKEGFQCRDLEREAWFLPDDASDSDFSREIEAEDGMGDQDTVIMDVTQEEAPPGVMEELNLDLIPEFEEFAEQFDDSDDEWVVDAITKKLKTEPGRNAVPMSLEGAEALLDQQEALVSDITYMNNLKNFIDPEVDFEKIMRFENSWVTGEDNNNNNINIPDTNINIEVESNPQPMIPSGDFGQEFENALLRGIRFGDSLLANEFNGQDVPRRRGSFSFQGSEDLANSNANSNPFPVYDQSNIGGLGQPSPNFGGIIDLQDLAQFEYLDFGSNSMIPPGIPPAESITSEQIDQMFGASQAGGFDEVGGSNARSETQSRAGSSVQNAIDLDDDGDFN